jgi:hypothetical protein
MTSSARSPITAKLFIQKNMPALRDELRKMSFSRQRRAGIETETCRFFAYKSNLSMVETIEAGAGTSEKERINRRLTRSNNECPISKEGGEEWATYRNRQGVLS